ncbi:unnamed protein product [Rotaria sp. Silwood2]|nr:unnamed protein product [Rotaria sp. Silwood2]CAF4654953.1 unnamed protein product [Rotaria sp. Silwood2]
MIQQKNASNLLDEYLIDLFNKIGINHNNELINKCQYNINELNYLIKNKFLQLDKQLSYLVNDQSGSISIISLIGPLFIYLINVGNSREIIISNDGQLLAFTKGYIHIYLII